MKNSKKILAAIGIIIIGGVLIFFVLQYDDSFSEPVSVESEETKLLDSIGEIEANPFDQTLPFSNDPKDIAWAVFQKYLAFNKEQNLEGVRSMVYKVAPVCEDNKTLIDCKARMGQAYKYGSALKKEDFVNIWSDGRQTILATDFKMNEDEDFIGRNRAIIFFVKTDSGLKMLSFSPFLGATVGKGTAPQEELNDRILLYTNDTDEDGIADYDEECLSAKEGKTCIKTNPKIRDTDGDGFWDSIQALMKS